MAGNPTTEQIDERILGLLGLEDEYELSYDEYVRNLKEAMVASRMSKSKFSTEESELVTNEWKRVKSKKGRFRPKKKKINAAALGIGKGLASPLKIAKQKLLLSGGKDFKGKAPIGVKEDNVLLRISNTLDSILQTLIDTNKENKKKLEKERIGSEEAKRAGREKELESKPFEGIKKALSTIVKPFQSILDRIINFITMALLGRAMIKLFDWFSNPDNKGKIQSIIRFFKDHWPVLLALYLRFGTGFGRAVGLLSKIVINGAIKLAAATARLLAAVGLKKFGGAARFLGGRGGKVLSAGLQIGAVVAGSAAIENLAGGGGDNKEQPTPKVEGRAGGGSIKIPNFKGGGFNFGGFGNMFGGLGNFFSGVVKGKKGVDKIPAMLSDGEFVMSAGAVRKHGVDTLEAMNAAGGGTNKPKMISGIPHAAGGGLIGDIPLSTTYGANPNDNTLRQAARKFSRFGTEEDLFKSFKKLGGVADFEKMVGGKENFQKINMGHAGADEALDAIRRSAIEKLKARNLPKLNTPRPSTIPTNRMLPAAGESSANAMRAAERAASRVRAPIPASRAIVPYTGGGFTKTGVTAGLSKLPGIKTNMRVPGGFGNIRSLGADLLLNYLMQKGFDYADARRVADQVGKGKKASPEKRDAGIEKLRNLVDKEERWQKGGGGLYDKIIGLGKETQSERLSKHSRAILSGLGANTYQGGKMVGGHGLKQQSFKDMPKTQIMSDPKGRPFIGHKAMRGGKPVYVRGPRPGEGTSNPFEMLGRSINPDAYKQVDAVNERKKYQEAAAGSIQSLKDRGASQVTIAKRQKELKKGVKPLPARPRTRFENPNRPGAGGGGYGGGHSSGGQKVPSGSATHPKGTRTAQATLGVHKK